MKGKQVVIIIAVRTSNFYLPRHDDTRKCMLAARDYISPHTSSWWWSPYRRVHRDRPIWQLSELWKIEARGKRSINDNDESFHSIQWRNYVDISIAFGQFHSWINYIFKHVLCNLGEFPIKGNENVLQETTEYQGKGIHNTCKWTVFMTLISPSCWHSI